jgi:hypothetical protein
MSDKFYANAIQEVHPACDTCMHRSKVSLGRCLAFPKGIPLEILNGTNDHTMSVAGDHGIRYKKAE